MKIIIYPLVLILSCIFVCTGCVKSVSSADSPSSTKRIALSYDDAPRGNGPRYTGPERTKAFIQQLEEAQTGPVAMFVTTRGLEFKQGKERIADYAKAGHHIANHSDTHMWASRSDTETYIQDIDRAETKLSDFDNRQPWYRFPYLDEGGQGEANKDMVKRDALRQALRDRNLMSGYVTVDTYDWYIESLWQKAVRNGYEVNLASLSKLYVDMVVDAAAHYEALAQKSLGRQPAHVLLLHENDLAASFTVDMVKALRAEGWSIIDPEEAFKDPIATQIPDTGFSGMGRISALAVDAGFSGAATLDHWAVSEAGIDARVKDGKIFMPPRSIYKKPE